VEGDKPPSGDGSYGDGSYGDGGYGDGVKAPPLDTATRRRTRHRILDATKKRLTAGEPLTKLSIQRIVKTAGVSRATFYLHFQSKQELIAALAKRELTPWLQSAAPALQNATLTRDVLEQLAGGAIEIYRANRGVLAGILEMSEYDLDTRLAWQQTIHEIADLFALAIRTHRPQLSSTQTEQLARLIVWAGERFLHQEIADAVPNAEADQVFRWTLAELASKTIYA
jgi:AcrR family transcriptional regulator